MKRYSSVEGKFAISSCKDPSPQVQRWLVEMSINNLGGGSTQYSSVGSCVKPGSPMDVNAHSIEGLNPVHHLFEQSDWPY